MTQYVPVAENENEDPIEVPTEPDGTLLLSNLTAQFPGASGLRYRSPDTSAIRAVKLVDGVLYQPSELASWCSANSRVVYTCTYSKDYRRRADADDFGYGQSRSRLDPKRCTDLIVLGLPYKADEDQLREYFSQYGQVMMTQVKRDHDGNSKGYGFIRFRDVESQTSCLSARHQIDGRRCEVKIPNSQADGSATAGLSKRVFVGRVAEDMSEGVLRDFFSQYGEIEEIYIPKPFRAFAFVTFADPDAAAGLIGQNCQIKGITLQIGPANPKQQTRSRYAGSGGNFGAGGGVGGAGGGGGGDFAVPPPNMGGWGPPTGHYGSGGAGGAGGAPYQDVVNSLASNPQLLAAALQQAYHQQPAAAAAAVTAAPAPAPTDPQQAAVASSQHYGNYAPYPLDGAAQYQHNGSYAAYQQPPPQQQQQQQQQQPQHQHQHHHHQHPHQLQQWQ